MPPFLHPTRRAFLWSRVFNGTLNHRILLGSKIAYESHDYRGNKKSTARESSSTVDSTNNNRVEPPDVLRPSLANHYRRGPTGTIAPNIDYSVLSNVHTSLSKLSYQCPVDLAKE